MLTWQNPLLVNTKTKAVVFSDEDMGTLHILFHCLTIFVLFNMLYCPCEYKCLPLDGLVIEVHRVACRPRASTSSARTMRHCHSGISTSSKETAPTFAIPAATSCGHTFSRRSCSTYSHGWHPEGVQTADRRVKSYRRPSTNPRRIC